MFEIITGEMKDCVWLGQSDDRILEYCDEKVVDDPSKKRLKFYCRASCKDFLPRRCSVDDII